MYLQRREINKRALDGRGQAGGGRRDAQTEGKEAGNDVGRGTPMTSHSLYGPC